MDRIGSMVSEVCLGHDLLISVLPVSAEAFAFRQSPFLINVRKEAVPL